LRNFRTELEYIPEKFKLCLSLLKHSHPIELLDKGNDRGILKYVPEKHKTVELCFEAVKEVGYELRYVPDRLKTNVNKLRINGGGKEADYKTGGDKMLKKTYHTGKEPLNQ
jgi:uncharacterized protein YoxC